MSFEACSPSRAMLSRCVVMHALVHAMTRHVYSSSSRQPVDSVRSSHDAVRSADRSHRRVVERARRMGRRDAHGQSRDLQAAVTGGMVLGELVVHGWDLARPTGRDPNWAPDRPASAGHVPEAVSRDTST